MRPAHIGAICGILKAGLVFIKQLRMT